MRDLLSDILQIARMQSGRMEYKPKLENLDALCREVIDEHRSHGLERERIVFNCQDSQIMGKFDKRLMQQVIGNLIANALK